MRDARDSLAGLRRRLAAIEAGTRGAADPAPFTFGSAALDAALGGGLPRAALHELFAASVADGAAAFGFALALTLRAANGRKAAWVREEMAARELGEVSPRGLAEFGADPQSVLLVRARDALSVLRAGHEALGCAGLGAVILEPWGAPGALDLTATRRLARAAARSGVAAFLLRVGAAPQPSAAMTRWRVRAAASAPLPAEAPGGPAFEISLLRHRAGVPPRSWHVEWDRDEHAFRDAGPSVRKTALPGAVVAAACDRPAAQGEWRRAG
jgi:protein ImuA